jgi:hypothetical protein
MPRFHWLRVAAMKPAKAAGRTAANASLFSGDDDGSQGEPVAEHAADRQPDQDIDDIHQSDDDEMGEAVISGFVSRKVVALSGLGSQSHARR